MIKSSIILIHYAANGLEVMSSIIDIEIIVSFFILIIRDTLYYLICKYQDYIYINNIIFFYYINSKKFIFELRCNFEPSKVYITSYQSHIIFYQSAYLSRNLDALNQDSQRIELISRLHRSNHRSSDCITSI